MYNNNRNYPMHRTSRDSGWNKSTKIVKDGANFRENYQERYREVNRELIKYVYSTVDISRFKYEIIRHQHQLSRFITEPYFLSPNYYGKNCLLVFNKIKSKYYSFLVDRRQLSYSIDKVKMDEVYIHHCNVEVDLSIYNGTILDGIYIRKDQQHEFIITDVYTFRGADCTGNKLNMKLYEIKLYLDNINSQIHNIHERINAKTNLELKVNNVFELTDIREFVDIEMKKISNDYQLKGVCFYPEKSGTKLIYITDDASAENRTAKYDNRNDGHSDIHRDRTVDTISDRGSDRSPNRNSDRVPERNIEHGTNMIRSKALVKKVYVAKTNEPIYAVLEMKSTNTVDNYKLFAVEQVKDGSSIKLKKCQMDIAYIPNMERSRWCKDLITRSHRGSVFVKCVWRDDKRKWEPLDVKNDVKLPSLMEDIRKNIIEMEISDSDTDDE